MATLPVLEIAGVRKQYQGLRPLRMNALSIQPGERVALEVRSGVTSDLSASDQSSSGTSYGDDTPF